MQKTDVSHDYMYLTNTAAYFIFTKSANLLCLLGLSISSVQNEIYIKVGGDMEFYYIF